MIIDPVAFRVGSLAVYWYGLIIATALVLGLIVAIRLGENRGVRAEFLLDFVIFGVPAAVIGARLYYVIFNWQFYLANPRAILAFREGGLAIHGAIIGGIMVLYFLCRSRQVPLLLSLDILAPGLVLGQALGRWGNFVNQEAYGGTVSRQFIQKFPAFIREQMLINGSYRHPAFLYESIWNIFVFLLLWGLTHRRKTKQGDVFFTYLFTYSLGRFFIEGLRTDSLMLGSLQVARGLSVLLMITGVSWLYFREKLL